MTPSPLDPTASRVKKPRGFNARFNAGLTTILEKLKVEEVPHIRRIVITVVGGTILVLGTALVALPIPGSGPVVILGGLAILGTEYAWARRWMRKGKLMAKKAVTKTQQILHPREKGPAAMPQPASEAPTVHTMATEASLVPTGEEKSPVSA